MKAVIQRVLSASLRVDGELISHVEKGYVIFWGVAKGDTTEKADWLVKKISSLRIFEDESCKINKSIKDIEGEILLVSQFTLMANATHGNRPDFLSAEAPERANQLYEYSVEKFKEQGIRTEKGVFGADMKIEQINDGPFTIILEK